MKLTEIQQRALDITQKMSDENRIFPNPNGTIGILLDIIATLQRPDAAPTDKGFQWSETRKCWIPYSVWIGDKETPLAGEGGDDGC